MAILQGAGYSVRKLIRSLTETPNGNRWFVLAENLNGVDYKLVSAPFREPDQTTVLENTPGQRRWVCLRFNREYTTVPNFVVSNYWNEFTCQWEGSQPSLSRIYTITGTPLALGSGYMGLLLPAGGAVPRQVTFCSYYGVGWDSGMRAIINAGLVVSSTIGGLGNLISVLSNIQDALSTYRVTSDIFAPTVTYINETSFRVTMPVKDREHPFTLFYFTESTRTFTQLPWY